MTETIRVLGIDLACRAWRDNGSAVLEFRPGENPAWVAVTPGAIQWPQAPTALTAQAMAAHILQFVTENKIRAISLDGPQGWRDPVRGPANRRGVGRWCEYLARCQGKVGQYGRTYPRTQRGWFTFCIDVFAILRRHEGIALAEFPNANQKSWWAPTPEQTVLLLECFPTSTWRTSGLAPLPGKRRVGNNNGMLECYANGLFQKFGLTPVAPWGGTHDDLQAVVAALPAAALLGGPCVPVPRGNPGRQVDTNSDVPTHWGEGLIWDACPLPGGEGNTAACRPAVVPPVRIPVETPYTSPVLLDDRDDHAIRALNRGVRLFRHLAECANRGDLIGVSFEQFPRYVHNVPRFEDLAGRPYRPVDTPYVVELAQQITEENEGRIAVTRANVQLWAGMDTFVWRKRAPHFRPDAAFQTTPYTKKEWSAVFPTGQRRLLTDAEWLALFPNNDPNAPQDGEP